MSDIDTLVGELNDVYELDGEIVALRGLKGEKGDKGDPSDAALEGVQTINPSTDVPEWEDVTVVNKKARIPVASSSQVGLTYIERNGSTVDIGHDNNDSYALGAPFYTVPLVMYDVEGYEDGTIDPNLIPSSVLNAKQDTLVSGTNIKTVNSQSLLGSGDIEIQGSVVDVTVNGTSVVDEYGSAEIPCVNNSRSGVLPPAGNVSETGEYKVYTDAYGIGTWKTVPLSLSSSSDAPARNSAVAYELNRKQDTLVSGTNIKTINNESLLGSGDIIIDYDDLSNKPTIPSKTSDLSNDSGYITGMVVLSYGNSTWNDFITAYNANKVVYCRASSGSDPSSGTQGRMAFMAYVNTSNSTPTSVEFQYYRSVSSHSASQQGDQVFVYTLNSSGTWSVTTREASTKIVAGTNMSSSYSSGTLTLNHVDSGVTAGTYDGGEVQSSGFYIPSFTVDEKGHITSATDLGNLIPTIGTATSSTYYLVGGGDWRYLPQMASPYGNSYRLTTGNTSATFTLEYPAPVASSDAYYLRVVSVEAFDYSTGESVVVDWSVTSPTSTGGKSSSITLSVSIAEAYTHTIVIHPMVAYANVAM